MNENAVWDNINVLSSNDNEAEIKDNMDSKSAKFKNYEPTWYNPKYVKPCYAASGAVALILLLIIIIVTSISSTQDNSSKAELLNGFLEKIVICDKNQILSYDPVTMNTTRLLSAARPIDVFDVKLRETAIFWIERNFSNARIVSSSNEIFDNLTHESSDVIFEENGVNPNGIAVDYAGDNVYFVDEAAGYLVVVGLWNKMYTLLLTELIRPKDVVLDSANGLMFILQALHSILMANMDGTDVRMIIQNGGVSALTLDRRAKRLYWVSDYVSIESSDYSGRNRLSFTTDAYNIISLTIFEDRLFWLWPAYGKYSTILSCRIVDDSCLNYTTQPLKTLHDPTSIKAFGYILEISNPCSVNRGGCQHLCLLGPEGRSCACKMGYQLNPDRTTCREIRDIILYVYAKQVRGRILDTTKLASVDAFWPASYSVNSLKDKGEIDFDYDTRNDDFYFSDDSDIYRMKLKKRENQISVLQMNTSNLLIEDLAYDWITGNMYFSVRSKTSTKRHQLMVFNVKRGSSFQKKTLQTFKYDIGFGLQACPYAMVIHPSKGYLFFTAGDNGVRFIQRSSMNGSCINRIHNSFPSFVHEHRLIAIDYAKERIYWIWDSDITSMIKHSNFDGTDQKSMSIDTLTNIRTLYVHQQWLYMSNQYSIWRVHKETGDQAFKIAPRFEILDGRKMAGVRVASDVIQGSGLDNPCGNNFGGCEQFCFYGMFEPRGVNCSCRDEQTVTSNGRCQ